MAEKQQVSPPNTPVSSRLDCFLKYINFKLINEEQLKLVTDYICSNLNASSIKKDYWYDMYSYSIKNHIVLRHTKKSAVNPVTQLGECVCQDKVINFLKNPDKKCFCTSGCASVLYKVALF